MVIAPTPVAALPPGPNPDDVEVDFDLAAYFWALALATWTAQVNALSVTTFNNAAQSAVDAATAQSNAELAVAAGSVTLWVADTYYTAGTSFVISPGNLLLYQRTVTGAGATDPKDDPTHWRLRSIHMVDVPVDTATQSFAAGHHYIFGGVTGAPTTPQVGTMPASQVTGDTIWVSVTNGLMTNQIDFGAKVVHGPGGTQTGVLTLDLGTPLQLRAIDNTTNWVVL